MEAESRDNGLLKDLKAELEQFQNVNFNQTLRINYLEELLEKYKQGETPTMEEAHLDVIRLKSELKRSMEECDEKDDLLRQAKEKIEHSWQEKDAMEKLFLELQSACKQQEQEESNKLKNCMADLERKMSEIEHQNATIARGERQNSELQAKLDTIQCRMADAVEENEQLQNENENLQRQLQLKDQDTSADHDALVIQLQQAENRLSALRSDMELAKEKARSENERLLLNLQYLKDDKTRLEGEMEKLDCQLLKASETNRELTEQIQGIKIDSQCALDLAQRKIEGLEAKIEKLEQSLRIVEVEQQQGNAQLTQKSQLETRLTAELASSNREMSSLKETLIQTQDELKEKHQELEQAHKNVEKIQQQLHETECREREIAGKLSIFQQRATELQRETGNSQQQLQQMELSANQTIDRLQNQIQSLEQRLKSTVSQREQQWISQTQKWNKDLCNALGSRSSDSETFDIQGHIAAIRKVKETFSNHCKNTENTWNEKMERSAEQISKLSVKIKLLEQRLTGHRELLACNQKHKKSMESEHRASILDLKQALRDEAKRTEKQLEKKSMANDRVSHQLQESLDRVQQLEKHLTERENQLLEKDQQLLEKTQQLLEKDQKIVENDQRLKEENLKLRENYLRASAVQDKRAYSDDYTDRLENENHKLAKENEERREVVNAARKQLNKVLRDNEKLVHAVTHMKHQITRRDELVDLLTNQLQDATLKRTMGKQGNPPDVILQQVEQTKHMLEKNSDLLDSDRQRYLHKSASLRPETNEASPTLDRLEALFRDAKQLVKFTQSFVDRFEKNNGHSTYESKLERECLKLLEGNNSLSRKLRQIALELRSNENVVKHARLKTADLQAPSPITSPENPHSATVGVLPSREGKYQGAAHYHAMYRESMNTLSRLGDELNGVDSQIRKYR